MQPLFCLDSRFAWCWLLPFRTGQRVKLVGFSEEECCCWQQHLAGCQVVTDADSFDALLVSADKGTVSPDQFIGQADALQVVCIIGDRRPVRRWLKVWQPFFQIRRDYGLLPSGNPRIIVPLGSAEQAVFGLALHRPGRLLARLAVRLARLLVSIGVTAPLGRRSLSIFTRDANLLPMGIERAGLLGEMIIAGQDYALYLGTPTSDRKTVVLPVGSNFPETILKIAETPLARAALYNEARVLQQLRQTVLSGHVPSFKGLYETEAVLTLRQEFRLRRPCSKQSFEDAVLAFLSTLSFQNRQVIPLTDLLVSLAQIEGERDKAYANTWKRLEVLASEGYEILTHRLHGDFAPWNCSWTSSGLFVYDWEEGCDSDVAFGDAFYYAIAPLVHVARRVSAMKMAERALDMAHQVAAKSDLPTAGLEVYFVLWVLKRVLSQKGQPGTFDYGQLVLALGPEWR